MRSFALLVLIALAGCPQPPQATECATGITCPEGTKCAAAQAICITNNCGDGITQSTETCDDGNIVDGDGCSADCRSTEVCGDGTISTAADELCDDGNTNGGDGCSADCKSVEVCGNAIRDVNEVCDDGNTVPGDGCAGNCKSTEVCGNGIVDINEICDDGSTPGGCNDDCQGGTGCGDGAIDKDGNNMPLEECDDGNTSETDDCIQCHLSSCGDTFIQDTGSRIEQCDPGAAGETATCNIDCTSAGCGDGKINNVLMEQCDDENANDHDACKNNCKLNFCGDGVDGGPNEACDTGGASATCDADCTSPMCGDGVVNVITEQCDNGMPGVSTAGCDANCTIPICGDGTTNNAAGEMCDDMNTNNNDDCRNDCKPNTCGDGYQDAAAPGVEACDDGNTMTELACPYGIQTCTACSAGCNTVLNLAGNTCGDGVEDASNEVCDDGNVVTETECPYGSATCMVCNASCSTETMLTNGKFCGDGVVSTTLGEACDDHNTMACGTCDPTCNVFSSLEATGYIVTVPRASLNDGETVTINDGTTSVVFEFDSDNMYTGERIILQMNDTASDVANKLRSAINASALKIDALDSGALVTLTHQVKTSQGNQAITDSVGNSSFVVSGMSGGAGGDCAAGIGCRTNADCLSGVCKADKTCQ